MRPRALLATALLLPLACAASTPEPAPHTAPATPATPPAPAVAPTAPVVAARPAPAPVGDCDLKATIASSRGSDGSTKYTLTLTNEGSEPRTLVTPGDGSEYARRTPILAWSGTRDGQPAPELERPGCGMMNVIEASEIFTLAAGDSRSMTDWILGPSYGPGTYEVRLRYHNDPTRTAAATASPEVAASLARSSACDVTSEPLTITVK